jgi:hypothetical protein
MAQGQRNAVLGGVSELMRAIVKWWLDLGALQEHGVNRYASNGCRLLLGHGVNLTSETVLGFSAIEDYLCSCLESFAALESR